MVKIVKKWWVSSSIFTCQVDTDSQGIVQNTCPLLRKFLGQHISSIKKWRKDTVIIPLPVDVISDIRVPTFHP